MMVIGGDRLGDRRGGMSLRRLIFVGGFRAMGGWVNVVVRLGLAIDNMLIADTCLPVHVPPGGSS